MKRFLLLFVFTMLVCCFGLAQVESNCDKHAPKISFTGKAPWSIDGKMDDWQTILGPYTGVTNTSHQFFPYTPPRTSSFNWVIDGNELIYLNGEDYSVDPDYPQPQSDLHFLSFTHDDYNVYFYFRRLAVDASSNSFYYFLDINSDEVMSDGEHVIHGSFNNTSITAFTLSRYVVNKTVNYNNGLLRNVFGDVVGTADPGNFMDANQYGATREGGEYIDWPIDKFPLSGSLVEVFNAASVPGSEKPKKGEVFAAALTEGGYGVELSIPIRYLRLWIVQQEKNEKKDKESKGKGKGRDKIKYEKTDPINLRTDIFFYHVSMQNNDGPYNPIQVVDNAGSCSSGVGISGNVNLSSSIVTTVLEPGHSYKFDITYQNLVSKATEVGIENIILHTSKDFETPIAATDYLITIYPDYNCNGKIDPGVEDLIDRYGNKLGNDYAFTSFVYDTTIFNGTDYENIYDNSTMELQPYYDYGGTENNQPTEIILPPLGKGCFIAILTIKPNRPALTSFDLAFESSVFFLNGFEFCEPSCGGRPINQVGRASTSFGTATLSAAKNPDIVDEEDATGIIVYPNPSNGNVTVSLPQGDGTANVVLEDYLGRRVQHWKNITSDKLQISNLKRGIYIVKVLYSRTGKMETRKIVVQ